MQPGAGVLQPDKHTSGRISALICPLDWVLVFRIQTVQPWKVALESTGRVWKDPLGDGWGNIIKLRAIYLQY